MKWADQTLRSVAVDVAKNIVVQTKGFLQLDSSIDCREVAKAALVAVAQSEEMKAKDFALEAARYALVTSRLDNEEEDRAERLKVVRWINEALYGKQVDERGIPLAFVKLCEAARLQEVEAALIRARDELMKPIEYTTVCADTGKRDTLVIAPSKRAQKIVMQINEVLS